jgi:hypothetical protein
MNDNEHDWQDYTEEEHPANYTRCSKCGLVIPKSYAPDFTLACNGPEFYNISKSKDLVGWLNNIERDLQERTKIN